MSERAQQHNDHRALVLYTVYRASMAKDTAAPSGTVELPARLLLYSTPRVCEGFT